MPETDPTPIPVSNHPTNVPVGHVSNVSETNRTATARDDTTEPQPSADTMKVVFYSHALGRGGAERWLVDLATGLSHEKFDAKIVLDNGYRDRALLRQASAVPVVALAKWNDSEPVDATVCWSAIPPKIKAKHTVFCLHGSGPFARQVAKNVGVVPGIYLTAVSEAAAELFAPYGPTTTIHNGCNPERLKPQVGREAFRQRLGIEPRTLVVGFLGRLAAVKQPHLVARAVARLRQKGIDARTMFVGDYQGHHRPRAKQVRSIDDQAIFTGPKEAIGDYVATMDVMMLPSQTEGFSLAKIEAWLAGVPVVATPVGAVPELEREHGALVVRVNPNADDDALADAVRLAVSPQNAAVVAYARKLAWREFTLDQMITRWERYLLAL